MGQWSLIALKWNDRRSDPWLAASGAPQRGRETNRPKWITDPVNSRPKVELGALEVKESLPATTGPGLIQVPRNLSQENRR